ncbi:unnamed protein product [Prunus armeniaca]
MAEMWRMIEELSRAMQAFQRQEHVDACMEIPEHNHEPLDIPEGGRKDDFVEEQLIVVALHHLETEFRPYSILVVL